MATRLRCDTLRRMAQSRWRLNLNQVLVSNVPNGANGAMDLVMRTDQATDYIFAAVGSFSRAHIFRNTDAGGSGTWRDVSPKSTRAAPRLPSRHQIKTSSTRWQHVSRAEQEQIQTSQRSRTPMAARRLRSNSSGDRCSWTTQTRNNSATLQDTLLLSNPVNGALTQCGIGTSQMLNQGWYDNVIVVDRRIPKVWAGGVDLFRSDNGGVNWGVASYWWFQGNGTPPNNVNPQFAHADNHVIAFHPNYNGTNNQTMFAGNDGGLFKSDNAATGNVGYSTARRRWRNHHAREPDLRCCIRAGAPSLFPGTAFQTE